MPMIPGPGQRLREAGFLLHSLDALRNLPALLLLCGTMCVGAWLGASATLVPVPAGILLVLLALTVVFYGVQAAGILMADEAAGRPPRAAADAVRVALAGGHRWLGVLLLAAAAYAGGLVGLVLLLLACKLPLAGPVLFALVFPVAVVVAGVAMLAIPLLVVPLTGPPAWSGADPAQNLANLWRRFVRRPAEVLVPMAALLWLSLLVAALSYFAAFAGTALVGTLSWTLLGVAAAATPGSGVPAAAMGYASAGFAGGSLVWSAASALPLLVYLRGACEVYQGLGVVGGRPAAARSDQSTVPGTLQYEAAVGILSRAEPTPSSLATTVTMMRQPTPEAPAGVDLDLPLDPLPPAPPPPPPAPPVLRCPACGFRVLREDRFCGSCGSTLQRPASP